jgi:hypothetical protein
MMSFFTINEKFTLLTLIFLIFGYFVFCQTSTTAVKNGLWSDASTWDNGVPINNRLITIPESFTVTFDLQSPTGSPGGHSNNPLIDATIRVFGGLMVLQAKTMYLCRSAIIIYPPNGILNASSGNDNSEKVKYCTGNNCNTCNITIWNAKDGPVYGYSFLGDTVKVLPVSLFFFQANKKESTVEIEWATASEKNNDYFILERAVASDEFERITIVNGSGNSNIPVYYSYTDNVIGQGTVYYRLSQYDYDGTNEMLGVIAVQPNQKFISDYLQFTNPVSASETFEIILLQEITGCIKLLSSGGRKIFSTTIHPATGKVQIPNLNPGFYLLHLETAEMNHVSKLIVY